MSSILLIQSDPVASARVCGVLDSDASLAVCGIVGSLEQARLAIERRVPDVLIGDLRLPDGPLVNLVETLRPGRSHVMVLVGTLRDPRLLHALRHGADAYLQDGWQPSTLVESVRGVLAGESPMAPEIARQVMVYFDALDTRPIAAGAQGPLLLTREEHDFLEWTAKGYLPEEVARGLEVGARHVGRLARSVYRRLHADMRVRKGKARSV